MQRTLRVLERVPTCIREYEDVIKELSGSFHSLNGIKCAFKSVGSDLIKDRFFAEDIPFIFQNARDCVSSDLYKRDDFIYSGENISIEYSRKEVIQLMACMTLGIMPGIRSECNFLRWQTFENCYNKFLLLEEYFHQMIDYPRKDEIFRVTKHKLINVLTDKDLLSSTSPLSILEYDMHKRIEDFDNYAFVDFANKCIGGGSLGSAAVQEEILFAIMPECCLSMALCSVMEPLEAISIENSIRIGNYSGYGPLFKYTGPVSAIDTKSTHIIAIDALCGSYDYQLSLSGIMREINKAYIGFLSCKEEKDGIATGKWGCGIFGGNAYLKSLLQWISASLCNKKIMISLFNDKELETFIEIVLNNTKGMTIGELFNKNILHFFIT